MSISPPTVLDSGGLGTDATSYSSGVIAPTANSLLMVFISAGSPVNDNVLPTITTTLGLTWTLVKSEVFSGNTGRGTWYRASVGGTAPTPGNLVFDFGAAVQGNCQWHVLQIQGANNVTPIVQTGSAVYTSTTNPSFALGAAPAATSMVLASIIRNNTTASTAMSGHTMLSSVAGSSGPTCGSDISYDGGSPSQNVGFTYASTSNKSVIGIEIAEGATGGSLQIRIASLISAIGADVKSLASGQAARRLIKNQSVANLTANVDSIEAYNVINDGTSSSGWPNRAEYGCTPVGGGTGGAARLVQYLNEYMEWRGNARQNTVLWRAFVREFAADPAHDMAVPIWEIQDDRDARIQKHGMFGQGNFYHSGTGTVGGDLAVSGNVTAANFGVGIKGVYAAGSEPGGQPTGTLIAVRP